MLTIGISGPIASGKSYFARSLMHTIHQTTAYTSTILSFSTGLKEIVRVFQTDSEHAYQRMFAYFQRLHYSEEACALLTEQCMRACRDYFQTTEDVQQKPRQLYQTIGTDIVRAFDPACWIRDIQHRIQTAPPTDIHIFDDVRFPNEYLWCDITIALTMYTRESQRIYEQRKRQLPAAYFHDHSSEHAQLPPATYSVEIALINTTFVQFFLPLMLHSYMQPS